MDRRLFSGALDARPRTGLPSRLITLISPSVSAERVPLVRLGLLRKD